MSWTNPKETETIIKNMVGSIIGDLELFDLSAYENINLNQQYKKELLTFFKKIFLKYGLLKTEFNSMIFMDDKEKNQESHFLFVKNLNFYHTHSISFCCLSLT